MAGAYLEVTLRIDMQKRRDAAEVYRHYRDVFLQTIPGAMSKELLVRDEDVQVLHGFQKADQANEYLNSPLFRNQVVPALQPFLSAEPEVRIYTCA